MNINDACVVLCRLGVQGNAVWFRQGALGRVAAGRGGGAVLPAGGGRQPCSPLHHGALQPLERPGPAGGLHDAERLHRHPPGPRVQAAAELDRDELDLRGDESARRLQGGHRQPVALTFSHLNPLFRDNLL